MIEEQIAEKIRKIRKSKGLTLEQLGAKACISRGMLSRLENKQSSPPIATLAKIAQALEVPIGIFFVEDGENTDQKYALTRRDQRREVVRRGTRIGFSYYAFNAPKDLQLVEAFIIKHPPIQKKPKALFDHPGEEFLLVLHGTIDLVYGRETIHLQEGDAIHFDPSIPHRVQNAGEEEAECLVVVAGENHYQSSNPTRFKGQSRAHIPAAGANDNPGNK
jgi:transcriptional regulator with XRE-family HTH domain